MSKKLYYALLALCIAAIGAGLFLILRSQKKSGADDPTEAVWGYQRAAMLYDADSMLRYSSEYNLAVLNDHIPKGAELEEYLAKQYSSVSSRYAGKKLDRIAEIVGEYERGSEEYAQLCEEYLRRAPDAAAPTRFAEIKLVIYSDGAKTLELTAYAAETGGKWYFYKNK